jgi:predicted PhzF superfamily epimerase YddE/YHI9
VPPHIDNAADEDVAEALDALGWQPAELDPALPPRVAYAGARHLVLAAATRERLADLDYDFARLRALMTARDWAPRLRSLSSTSWSWTTTTRSTPREPICFGG